MIKGRCYRQGILILITIREERGRESLHVQGVKNDRTKGLKLRYQKIVPEERQHYIVLCSRHDIF
jgi:hypothetical protein